MMGYFKKITGNETYQISQKELKDMYDAIERATKEKDDYQGMLEKMIKLHRLSVALSTRSLAIIERIKFRYPYIFNECTDDEDTKFVVDLIRQITE